jgi:hypothetical protein
MEAQIWELVIGDGASEESGLVCLMVGMSEAGVSMTYDLMTYESCR